jgi:hypothetical protein
MNSRRRMPFDPFRGGYATGRDDYTWACCAAGFQTSLRRLIPCQSHVLLHRGRTLLRENGMRLNAMRLAAASTAPVTSCPRAGRREVVQFETVTLPQFAVERNGSHETRACVILSHGKGLEDQHREARQRGVRCNAPGTVPCRHSR